MNQEALVIGLDYGSDSVRAILVNTSNGHCLAGSVFEYPRWKQGKYCDPVKNQFRQHPLDHLEGLKKVITGVIKDAAVAPSSIKAICVDTTGSSPIAVDKRGTPLSLTKGFEENPNAMLVLWKDHTAVAEADEINALARTWGGEDFTKYEGGIYSSEWFWAKILHIIRKDKAVATAAYSWMEHCDVITADLIGCDNPLELKRSRCAAGHKALWHEHWGGLPPEEFLEKLDPRLASLRDRLYTATYTSDQPAGKLSASWAQKLGLSENVIVAVGTFDAHAGAIGGEITENTLVKVMGTSTCDIMVASKSALGDTLVKGICGQVDGSVIPGTIGLEAGQSGFGDLLAWFKQLISWPTENILQNSTLIDDDTKFKLLAEIDQQMIVQLSDAAEKIAFEATGVTALDWINGRRTPDANQNLKGAVSGLTMGTDAPRIFRALVEAICFGSKKIVDRFQEEGLEIKTVIGLGGVAKKSRFVMQTLADVLNMPIKVATSEQAPALGAAMYAAVAAGIYQTTEEAIKAMSNGFDKTYTPNPENVATYRHLYEKYNELAGFVEKSTLKKKKSPAFS